MRTSKRYAMGGLLLSFAWLLAGGCGASGSNAGNIADGSDGGTSAGGTQGKPTMVDTDAGTMDGNQLARLNALCGAGAIAGSCVPDNARACINYKPPVETPLGSAGAAAGDGAGGESSPSGGGGEAGQPVQPGAGGGAGDGPVEAQGGDGGRLGAGGAGGAPSSGLGGAHDEQGGQAGASNGNPAELARYSCQVGRENNQPVRQCVTAGTGVANSPCFTAADCAPGLACVTEGDAGRCLRYCCDRETSCDGGDYCAERPLRKAPSDISSGEPPHVPVCVPADNCSLEDRYPCPAGSDCRCKGDTACMVVRNDGATTCLKPGSGQEGDPCPCAWNHVCSSQTNLCVEICRTDPTKNDCGVQKCQASSELPNNFGVCVGPTN